MPTLNATLAALGLTTRPAMFGRKDITEGGTVLLDNATAGATWKWLRKTGRI